MTYTGLYLGDLHLTGTAAAGYKVELAAEGTDWGNPESVEVAIQSLLQDGDLVEHTRDGNRAQTLRLILTGTAAQLQQGEAALMAELYKRNTLTVPPLLAGGATTVFDIVTSSLNQIPDDLAEVQANQWHYSVRLVSLPFGRSEDEVTVPALAASGTTTTLVDDGSATTNWTGTIDGASATVAVVSGAVGITSPTQLSGNTTLSLTRTAAITTSATKYLVVDYLPTVATYTSPHQAYDLTAFGDGVPLARIQTMVISTGVRRAWFLVAAASVTTLRFDLIVRSTLGGTYDDTRTFHIDNIDRTDIRPSIGSTRQQIRTLDISGSVRTPGALTVSHASSALGDAIVYVFNNTDPESSNYVPALSIYGSTARTADTSKVAGSYDSISAGTGRTYLIPATAVPDGGYIFMARIAAASGTLTAPIDWNMRAVIGGAVQAPNPAGSATVDLTTTQTIYTLGRVQLPTLMVGNRSTSTLRVNIQNEGAATIHVDELWLFNTSIGQLSWVKCGVGSPASGGSSRRLILEPANVTRPMPRIMRGHATDNSDAFFPAADEVQAWTDPHFLPSTTSVFTVTTNALDAAVDFTCYPHWHTHAGAVA